MNQGAIMNKSPTFKPILAEKLMQTGIEHTDTNILKAMYEDVTYPVIASPKYDGVRALRLNGSLLSRKLILIPNKSIRERSMILQGGMDMELACSGMAYNDVESIVMSREHEDSDLIRFYILDRWIPNLTFEERLGQCNKSNLPYREDIIPPVSIWCKNANELFNLFITWEQEGYEGICFRDPKGPYKYGRSTLNEGYLIKLARNIRDEVKIIGMEEALENTSVGANDNLGNTKHTSHNDLMVGKNTMGALICMSNKFGEVRVGTGFSDKLRKDIWENSFRYVGQTITIQHKPVGAKDKPRHPVFVGFRKDI